MNKDIPNITIDDVVNAVEKYLSKEEIEQLKKAYTYASQVHKNQKRLTGYDYIKHPLNVVYILSSINADSDTLIAAMLHDTISVGEVDIKDIEILVNFLQLHSGIKLNSFEFLESII